MAKPRKHPWRNALITLGVLLPIGTVVVYSSFQVSDYQCEVCMRFEGREACGKTTGKTEAEGRRSAMDNACAQVSSGVTDTLRCSRTEPTKSECRALGN